MKGTFSSKLCFKLLLNRKSVVVIKMFKNSANIIRGIFIGMMSGIILGASASCMMREQRKVKRKAGRAVHAVGDFIDQIPCMFK